MTSVLGNDRHTSLAPGGTRQAPPPALREPLRLHCVDWLRGLSVLAMVGAHALYFLSPTHDNDPARAVFNEIDGVPGPTFIFASGLSLAFVTAWQGDEPARRMARARKSITRIGHLLLVSLFLRYILWDCFARPASFLSLDILSCIALMLLGVWTVLFCVPYRWRSLVLAMLASGVFFAAPWLDAPRTFGWATGFINNGLDVARGQFDTWPLVPWSGYGFLGALVGLTAGRSREPIWTLAFWACAMVGIGAVVASCGDVVESIDGRVNSYVLTNAGARVWRIGLIALALLSIQGAGIPMSKGPGRLIGLFSRQSLVAFAAHLVWLFGWGKFRPLNRFHQQMDWPGYVVLMLTTLALTALTCWVWEAYSKRRAFRREYAYAILTPARRT